MSTPDRIREFMADYNVGKDEVWQVPGGKSWAVKHSALERIAAEKGITFDLPQIIEGSTNDKVVTILVVGRMGDNEVWSFGEASPANCRNAYVWSMAEKRAKDRCILKLLAVHGAVYSEDEADEFKHGASSRTDTDVVQFPADPAIRRSSNQIKRDQPGRWSEIETALRNCVSEEALRAYSAKIANEVAGWPETWRDALIDVYEGRKSELRARA